MQVSIWLVRAIISAVERAGRSRSQFLALARIDPELVAQHEASLHVDDYIRAIDAAYAVTCDPALGIHMGEHSTAAMYHVVAHLVEHATTLGEAIHTMVRYSSLLAVGYEPCLVEEGDRACLRLPYLIGESNAVHLTAEFSLTGFMRMLRQYLGETLQSYRACFAYPEPAHAAEYRRVFRGAVSFDQRHTEMQFPRSWLAHPQPYANTPLYTLLQSHAERELAELSRGATVVETVRRALAARDPRALPTMADLARELDISARTLARKLHAEGATYAALVEDRRTRAAKYLLGNRRMTIQEIADAMGFADASAFHRAFRRWTGLTPRQYVSSAAR